MAATKREVEHFGELLLAYCEKYYVHPDEIFQILEDQKVTPMIRGKATEFNAVRAIRSALPKSEWLVEKLNLNPQPTRMLIPDIDIQITHKRTATRINVESKSAVRCSMKDSPRCKIKVPHFRVKIHRSRSHLTRAGNDRYAMDHFDILITHPLNAIYQGKTLGADLELIHDPKIQAMLYSHYGTTDPRELFVKCADDWRFCIPKSISVNGFIERTPPVSLVDDKHWRPLHEIGRVLMAIVERSS